MDDARRSPRDHPAPLFGLSFLLALAIIVSRDPHAYLAPAALLEDGKYLLEYYRAERGPGAVFRYYQGYVSLVPNLVGYLAAALPIWLALHVLQVAATLVTALACAVPAARFFLPGALGGTERIVLVLLLAGLPAANFALHQLTIYSIWHMLLAACLVVGAAHVSTRGQALAAFCIIAAAIVSHPAAVVLLPLLLFRAATGRGLDRLVFSALIAASLLYLILGIETPGGSGALSGPEGPAALAADVAFAFSERVVGETLVGTKLRMALKWYGLGWLFPAAGILAALLLGAAAAYMLRRRGPFLMPFLSFVYISAALLVFTTATRGAFLDIPYAHRYSYLSAVTLVLALTLVLYRLFDAWPSLRRPAYAGIALWLAALNALSLEYYRVDPRQGALMQAALRIYEQRLARDATACVTLKRETFWDVTLASGPGLECIEVTSPERSAATGE